MKLKTLSLLGVAAASVLAGCGNNNNNANGKVTLSFGDMNLTSYITLTKDIDVQTLRDKKENFILVSYADPNCGCWGTFSESVLIPYVKETHIPIYAIYTRNIADDDFHGLPISSDKSNTPVIGIYKDGQYKVGANYFSNEHIFKKIDDFKNYMNRYITAPAAYYVSFNQLDTMLKGDDKFILYWSWKLCPDCSQFDLRFLKDYFAKNNKSRNVPFYLIETHDVRQTDQWQAIKDKYGLSETFNTASGFGKGYVPTLQMINPDGTDHLSNGSIAPIIEDMFVCRNEFFSNENGVYTITDSYFNGVRGTKYLGAYETEIGKTVTAADSTERNTIRDAVHDDFAKKFLDFYWK